MDVPLKYMQIHSAIICLIYGIAELIIQIIKFLQKEAIKSPTGRDVWSKKTIENILTNEKYIGNVVLYKTFSGEFPNTKRIKNNGEHKKYCANNNHPPIIDEEIFEKVQSERIRRSNIEITSEVKKRKSRKYSLKKPNYDKTHD